MKQRIIIEITQDMVGKSIINHFLGKIMEHDVGKRLYLGEIILMENEEQYLKRICPNSVKFIKEEI